MISNTHTDICTYVAVRFTCVYLYLGTMQSALSGKGCGKGTSSFAHTDTDRRACVDFMYLAHDLSCQGKSEREGAE